jgi:hypothetical protein
MCVQVLLFVFQPSVYSLVPFFRNTSVILQSKIKFQRLLRIICESINWSRVACQNRRSWKWIKPSWNFNSARLSSFFGKKTKWCVKKICYWFATRCKAYCRRPSRYEFNLKTETSGDTNIEKKNFPRAGSERHGFFYLMGRDMRVPKSKCFEYLSKHFDFGAPSFFLKIIWCLVAVVHADLPYPVPFGKIKKYIFEAFATFLEIRKKKWNC